MKLRVPHVGHTGSDESVSGDSRRDELSEQDMDSVIHQQYTMIDTEIHELYTEVDTSDTLMSTRMKRDR